MVSTLFVYSTCSSFGKISLIILIFKSSNSS